MCPMVGTSDDDASLMKGVLASLGGSISIIWYVDSGEVLKKNSNRKGDMMPLAISLTNIYVLVAGTVNLTYNMWFIYGINVSTLMWFINITPTYYNYYHINITFTLAQMIQS